MRSAWVVAIACAAGCSWTTFDDLSASMWAQSTQKPNVGSSDWAIAIAGATTTSGTARLAVIGNSSPTYSTLDFDAKGNSSLGPNPQKLGQHFIASLDEQPILVGDGQGKIALVASAIDAGNIAVVSGDAEQVADTPFPSTDAPAAAELVDDDATLGPSLVIAAGQTLFVQKGSTLTSCAPHDTTGTAVSIVALAHDSALLWAWTSSGELLGYTLSLLSTCTAPSTSAPPTLNAGPGSFTTTSPPGTGAHVLVSDGAQEFIVLAGGAAVTVVDVNSTFTQVGTPLAATGMASAALLSTDTGPFVALGFPDAMVGSVITGQVELHALDATMGTLDATAAETLNDAQPDADEAFGRALATMTFNGKSILVVAASSEVFAYYRTQLYGDTR